jgi:hypothetical protein
MRAGAIAAILVAAGCGRFSFDGSETPDAAVEPVPEFGLGFAQNMGTYSAAEQLAAMDDAVTIGARWFAVDLDWYYVQRMGPTSFDFARDDVVVQALRSRGIHVLLRLTAAPPWAQPGTCNTDKFCPPANLQDYVTFVSAAVTHYAPLGVHHWEVWTQPNVLTFWRSGPDAAAYTAMLVTASSAIKAADPTATVVTGGLSPAVTMAQNISPLEFLTAMYAAGAKDSFDALGNQPYCWDLTGCPSQYDPNSAWSMMGDTPNSLRTLMEMNGDGDKRIWLTNFGAPTVAGPVNEMQQAQLLTDAAALLRSYSWAGPMFWFSYRDIAVDGQNPWDWFGVVRPDFSAKPAHAAFAAAAF